MQEEFPGVIKEVRGRGCMIGVDLSREGQPIVDELQRRGILVNCTNTTVLRMLPPYIVTREECDRVVASLRELLGGAS
jgi:acetylornithine/succinyldiaminopimelate/putrescine aminotransferase